MGAIPERKEVAPTVKRLIALLTAGYRIREQDLGDADNYISLEHPATRQNIKEKALFLYDEGTVMGGPRVDNTCLLIGPDDATQFQQLIATTPKPTWWECNSGPFYTVWAWVIICVITIAGATATQFAWKLLFDK